MALIKNITELKQYVKVAETLPQDVINVCIPDAQEKYIRNVLGDELLEDLDTWHSMTSPTEVEAYSALLPYVQRALARFALLIASAELDVTITSSGIGVVSTQNLAPASADRVKKLNESNEQRGWDNIETLIRFLEENKDDYPEWVASSAYTLSIRNMVNSAVEFDSIIPINKSRLYFSRIRPILDDIDILKIKAAISTELFDAIVTQLRADDVSEANAVILPYLKRAEVYYAAVDSIDKAKYSDGDISKILLNRDIDTYTNKADAFLMEVRKVLDKNPDSYPLYRDSDQYLGLDEDGNTQYTGFDNTDDEAKIFVM